MGIPIGKLSLYTACGGIHPASTLPIMLDVGTNNQQHLDDPLYMGWRHPRISDEQYAEFMDMFISTVNARWPTVLLQFEDFAQKMRPDYSSVTATSCAASMTIFREPLPSRPAR